MDISVIKRSGNIEPFRIEKIQQVFQFAAFNLNDIQANQDEFWKEVKNNLKPKMKTTEIQDLLIGVANRQHLKNPMDTNWSILAARLSFMDLVKQVRTYRINKGYTNLTKSGCFQHYNDFVDYLESLNVYHPKVIACLKNNSHIWEPVWKVFVKDRLTDLKRNPLWNLFYYQIEQIKKYLIKIDNQIVELPNEMFFLMAVRAFADNPNANVDDIENFLKYLESLQIIPATPQFLNLRKAKGGLSSCNIFGVDDTLESIIESWKALATISKRAGGVGIYMGRLRPSASYLMGNKGVSNHINIWSKILNQIIIAVNQGGLRKGALTVALPVWHKDVIDFINIRNPIGDERLRAYDIFPQVIVNDTFLEAVKDNKDWYLVDLKEVEETLKKLYGDDKGKELFKTEYDLVNVYGKEFERRYRNILKLIQTENLTNYVCVKARDVIWEIIKNQIATGLPYIFFEDNVNKWSQFNEKIHSGNLCMENFSPFTFLIGDDKLDKIHSCNLISLNIPAIIEHNAKISEILQMFVNNDYKLSWREYQELLNEVYQIVRIVVQYMNQLLDLSDVDMPLKAIHNHNKHYRTIGIGFIGLADVIAKFGLSYTRKRGEKTFENTIKFINLLLSAIALAAIKASANYPVKAPAFENTEWKNRFFKIERSNIEQSLKTYYQFDKLFDSNEDFNNFVNYLKALFAEVEVKGLANTMLLNAPPNTSTSLVAGATASVLPPFARLQIEEKKGKTFLTFPRYINTHFWMYNEYSKFDYQDLFDILEVISNIQNWIDSGISFELAINHSLIDAEKIPELLLKLIYKANKLNIKTLYYVRNIVQESYTDNQNKTECLTCAN